MVAEGLSLTETCHIIPFVQQLELVLQLLKSLVNLMKCRFDVHFFVAPHIVHTSKMSLPDLPWLFSDSNSKFWKRIHPVKD